MRNGFASDAGAAGVPPLSAATRSRRSTTGLVGRPGLGRQNRQRVARTSLAEGTLTAELSEALAGVRGARERHDPGRVLVDLAVAVAGGVEARSPASPGVRTVAGVEVSAVLDLGGPLADHDFRCHMAVRPLPGTSARDPQRPPSAQTRHQFSWPRRPGPSVRRERMPNPRRRSKSGANHRAAAVTLRYVPARTCRPDDMWRY